MCDFATDNRDNFLSRWLRVASSKTSPVGYSRNRVLSHAVSYLTAGFHFSQKNEPCRTLESSGVVSAAALIIARLASAIEKRCESPYSSSLNYTKILRLSTIECGRMGHAGESNRSTLLNTARSRSVSLFDVVSRKTW